MTWTKFSVVFSGCAAATVMAAVLAEQPREPQQTKAVKLAVKADEPEAQADLDPTALPDKARRVIETYCVSCYGTELQKGDVRFDALETIDPVDQQKLYENAKEALQLQEMPPEKAMQPSEAERAVLMQWLNSQLTGEAAKALAEQLLRFDRRRFSRSGRAVQFPICWTPHRKSHASY